MILPVAMMNMEAGTNQLRREGQDLVGGLLWTNFMNRTAVLRSCHGYCSLFLKIFCDYSNVQPKRGQIQPKIGKQFRHFRKGVQVNFANAKTSMIKN